MRAWHIAARLALEHEVRLVTTSPYCELEGEGFEAAAVGSKELDAAADWSDILVLQGYVTQHNPRLVELDKVIVFDVYDPLHLETLALTKGATGEARDWHVRASIETLNRQLARADFLMCATERQRDLFMGQLCGLGRANPHTYDDDPTLRRLIDVVPFGLPDVDPVHRQPALRGVVPGIGPEDDLIVWAGGVYDWFDPLTLVRAVASLAKRRPSVRLFFMGLKHPNPGVPEMQVVAATRALASELGLAGKHVFFNEGWVDYADRENFLLEATVGVTTHYDSAETRYSFRTRALDYLWAALPMVTTEGDAFAELVETEGLGFTVPPEDPEALEDALVRLLYDKELAEGCRARAAAVRKLFRWSAVLEPLAEFCRRPRRAPDLAAGATYGAAGYLRAAAEHAPSETAAGAVVDAGGPPQPFQQARAGDGGALPPAAVPNDLPVAVEPTGLSDTEPAVGGPARMTIWQLARHHYREGGLPRVAWRAAQKAHRLAAGGQRRQQPAPKT
jgi:glycosyltransferase involved in cell wall biosynthesis